MSSLFSERDIEEIRNRVNLVDLVSEYASLKRSGRRFRALCPFHSEKTPSFYVDPDKQLYHCFGCGAGGDIFTFVMEMEKLTFPEAVEYLAQKAGVTLTRITSKAERSDKEQTYKLLEYAAKLYQAVLFKTEEGKKALKYLLEERGISLDSIKQFEIGFSPTDESVITKKLLKEGFKEKHLIESGLSIKTSRGLIDRFRGRIIFPIKDIKDRVVGFGGRQFLSDEPKYLNTPETPYFKKGSLLYNLNRAKHYAASEDKILIVEGYTDVIALHEVGIPYVVATLGTALTETHFSVISRFTKNVYLAFDADSAGRKAAERGLELISSAGNLNARVVLFPEGKDPADFCKELKNNDAKDVIEKMLNESVPLEDFVIKRRISGFNLLDPKEKSQAAEEAARVISVIADPVVRDEYVKKYSSRLGLSVDSFMTKISNPWYNKKVETGRDAIPKEKTYQSTSSEEEFVFFRLLYQNYENRIKKSLELLESDYFTDDVLKLAFGIITEDPERYADESHLISELRNRGGEEAVKRITIAFIDSSDVLGQKEDYLERIFEELIVYIRAKYFRDRIQEVKEKIIKAEESGNFEEASKYLEELQYLTSILRSEQF